MVYPLLSQHVETLSLYHNMVCVSVPLHEHAYTTDEEALALSRLHNSLCTRAELMPQQTVDRHTEVALCSHASDVFNAHACATGANVI